MKKNKYNEILDKIEFLENAFSGEAHGYNPYRDAKTGRFTTGPGLIQDIRPPEKPMKVEYEGKTYTPEGVTDLIQEGKEAGILDRVSSNLDDLIGLEAEVRNNHGWRTSIENGEVVGRLDKKITRQVFSLGKNEERVMNDGKRYLEDNNEEYYESKPTDEDGFAVYTTDSHKSAMNYAENDASRICYLVVNYSNFIGQKELNKIRSSLRKKANSDRLKKAFNKSNGYTPVRDTTLAVMLGYDGIIRRTKDSGTEYIVINPDTIGLDKISDKKRVNQLIDKMKTVLNDG